MSATSRRRLLLCRTAIAMVISVGFAGCGDGDGAPEASDPTSTSGTAPSTVDGGAGDRSWSGRASAPQPATEVGAALFERRIWVVGGFTGDGSPLEVVQVYDPSRDSWSTGPPLPVAVHHATVVATADSLLVVGGYRGDGFGEPTDSVWVMTPGGDDWSPGPPLPSPRGAGAGAWDGTRVVFGGGVGPAGLSAEVWALSGAGWTTVGRLSEARDHLGAASDGEGRVWFMGGRLGSLDSNRATVDLVEEGRLRRVGDLPTARGGAAGFHGPSVGACLAGGEANEGTFEVVECIDEDGRTTTLAPLALARHGLGTTVVDGVAYSLLGGPAPGLTASGAVEALELR